MTDKKITIASSDGERLRELMREEEAKLDAADPSDAELSIWEKRQQESIKQLARRLPSNLPSVTDEMDRNWLALQEKMKKAEAPAPVQQKPADVLPLKKTGQRKTLPWLGLLAAVALVLIMVRPRGSDQQVMDEQNIQFKGSSTQLSAADCEVDARAADASPVTPAANGQGFVGAPGTLVELTVRCNRSGFMRAELQGPETQILITPVVHGERQTILREGQVARIPLQTGKPWVISLIYTAQEFSKDTVVPQDQILWQDKISLGVPQ